MRSIPDLPARSWQPREHLSIRASHRGGHGFGLTSAIDRLAVKLMLISDLTGEHSLFMGFSNRQRSRACLIYGPWRKLPPGFPFVQKAGLT
jgi:hypothetical protein